MAQQFTFPQSGDADDAEHFGSMIGQANLSDYVEEGFTFTPDYTAPSVDVSTGKAYISTASETASSTGDTILNVNHVVQAPAQTVSLADSTTNYVYLEANLGSNDSPTINAYTSTQTGTVLLLGTVDTTNDTYTVDNREQEYTLGRVTLGNDDPIEFGDTPFTASYDSGSGAFSISEAGTDRLNVGSSQIDAFLDLDLNGNDIVDGASTIYDGTNGYINQTALQNDSVTVNAGQGLQNGGAVALGGSTTLDIEPSQFAGNALVDDGSNNLAVAANGIGTNELDLSMTPTWTGGHTFNSRITINSSLIWQDTNDNDVWRLASSASTVNTTPFTVRFDNRALRFYDGDNGQDSMTFHQGGNVTIHNGNLEVSGSIDVTSGDINNTSAIWSPSSSTGTIDINDRANNQYLMRFRNSGSTLSHRAINMNQNQLTNMVVDNRTTDPGSPAEGQMWIRTDL